VLSFFSIRRNWDSPNPSSAGEYAPPSFGSGGRGTLAGERGGGRVPIPTRGHTPWYSIYKYFVVRKQLINLPSIQIKSLSPEVEKVQKMMQIMYIYVSCYSD
jgi:hypothetical protein